MVAITRTQRNESREILVPMKYYTKYLQQFLIMEGLPRIVCTEPSQNLMHRNVGSNKLLNCSDVYKLGICQHQHSFETNLCLGSLELGR